MKNRKHLIILPLIILSYCAAGCTKGSDANTNGSSADAVSAGEKMQKEEADLGLKARARRQEKPGSTSGEVK